MKTKKLLLVLAAITLLFAITIVGCDERSTDNDSTKDNVTKAANFESVDPLGNIYILAINGETSRAVYKGAKGDDYALTIKHSGQPDKESKGIVSTINADGELTMKPTKADDTFNVSISKSGKMTAITGTIILVDGTTVEAPGFLSVADMAAWLSAQGDNSVDKPYTVKLNVSDIAGTVDVIRANNTKYVNLDISGSTFTFIGGDHFYGCTSLAGLTIANGVTVELTAFAACPNLTAINVAADNSEYSTEDGVLYNKDKTVLHTYPAGKIGNPFIIPDGVTNIESYAFTRSAKLAGVTIPDSVISIGRVAFGYSGLTTIIIGNGVTSIGSGAFNVCTSLTGVTIPDSVIDIGEYAFYGCTSLTSITIGNGVTSIGDSAFSETPWLNNQQDGLVYVGKTAYIYKGAMPANTSITILDGTEIIFKEVFKDCKNLIGVTIPNSVTNIGDSAFYGTNLTGVTIPASVTSIGTSAFSGTQLTNVTIPSGVTSIGYYAFYTSSITEINVDSGNSVYSSEDGVLYNKDKTVVIIWPLRKSITIPNSVTGIERYAFYGNNTRSVTIPANVTSIGDSAFNCSYLTSVTFEGVITPANLGIAFYGDLRAKYLAGGIGTYTTTAGAGIIGIVPSNAVWTKQ